METQQQSPNCSFLQLLFSLWAFLVRRRRTARDFHPITVSPQPVGSARENECVIFKQWVGTLHVCTGKSSLWRLFPRESTFEHNTGRTSVHDCFWKIEHLRLNKDVMHSGVCLRKDLSKSSVTATTTVLSMKPSSDPDYYYYYYRTNKVV